MVERVSDAILGLIPVSPRWLTVSELYQSWCVSSLLMGDHYCGVKVLAIIHLVFVDENPFVSPKSCSDGDHASPIKPPTPFDEGLLT